MTHFPTYVKTTVTRSPHVFQREEPAHVNASVYNLFAEFFPNNLHVNIYVGPHGENLFMEQVLHEMSFP